MCARRAPPAGCRSGSGTTGSPARTTRSPRSARTGRRRKASSSRSTTSPQGNKIMMTATAESQAQAGHDILQFLAWYPLSLAKSLEPVDDVMGGLLKQNGKVSPAIEYLVRSEGHWL